MSEPRRGEIWIADFGRIADAEGAELMKVRPALVVSRSGVSASGSQLLLVVPASTTKIDLPGHLSLEPGEGGLDAPSYLACEEVRTLSADLVDRERGPIGTVSDETMRRVDRHVERVLERE